MIVAEDCDSPKVKMLLADQETNKIVQFLMGLNDEFAYVRSQILNTKPRPSLSNIYNMLNEDESQRMKHKAPHNPSVFSVQSGNSHVAIAITNHGYQKNADKPRAICSHCNMIGHIVDICYKIHGIHQAGNLNGI